MVLQAGAAGRGLAWKRGAHLLDALQQRLLLLVVVLLAQDVRAHPLLRLLQLATPRRRRAAVRWRAQRVGAVVGLRRTEPGLVPHPLAAARWLATRAPAVAPVPPPAAVLQHPLQLSTAAEPRGGRG
eukprot:SAG11_NODE_363_length_10162_cov_28.285004_3_plen_127_part_00